MPRRSFWPTALLVTLAALSSSAVARAVITKLTPLKEVVADEQHIFVATVEKLAPEKPAMVLKVAEELKGKAPFERLPVNLTGDAEAQKEKHTDILVKRLAEKQSVIVFASKRGKRYTAFGFTNGTWFQLSGQVGDDDAVRWSFLHAEPYLRRTFKGTTEELKQVIADALAEKKAPPEPDAKAEPGYGPEVAEKKDGASLGRGGLPLFAVIPTFVLVGPLAILAAPFPAVFGGLALLMKRWMVLLSVACTASTLYFLQAWFLTRLQGTLWGTPQSLWITFAAMSAVGEVWAGARYRHAVANGQGDVWLLRKFDRVSLLVLSVAGAATLAVVAANGGSLLASPWLDILVVSASTWAGAAFVALRQPHIAPVSARASAEVVILWALAFGCANAGTLEYGRGASGGFGGGASAVHDDPLVPKLAGLAWQQPFEAEDRGAIFATPAVTPERVYVAGMHGTGLRSWGVVYAIDPASGGKLWQFDDDGALKQVFGSPCVAEGKVFVGEGLHEDKACKLFCLDAATGKKLWEFPTSSHTESTPCAADGKVFFGAGDDGLYALDVHTGEKLWQYPGVHVDSNPTFHDGRVYAGSGLSRSNERKMIFCLDANTGKELWTHATEYSAYGSPLVTRKYLYCGTGNGNYSVDKPPVAGTVLCLDATTGKQVWDRPLPNSVVAKPANDRKNVYVGCRDGSCYALDRKTGEIRWERKMGSPVLAAPAVKLSSESGSGQAVYVASENGLIASLSPATGEPFWQFDLAKHSRLPNIQIMSSPAVSVSREGSVERRRIYFGAKLSGAVGIGSSARLYCLQEEVRLDFDEE